MATGRAPLRVFRALRALRAFRDLRDVVLSLVALEPWSLGALEAHADIGFQTMATN